MNQAEGMLGRFVDGMIRRSVKARFRNVYWTPPSAPIQSPAIFVANHHGWHDGYLMYHLVTKLGARSLDWITEFGAFPLFAKVGGMPFPREDAVGRATTIRRTIRLMREEGRSLILFAESELHRPPMMFEFGKALETVASKVPGVAVIPVGIRYDMSIHERPEAILSVGAAVELGPDLARRTRLAVQARLDEIAAKLAIDPEGFEVLASGTPDVNERWDFRRPRGRNG